MIVDLEEFEYLENGFYKNLSEGIYEIEIVLTYNNEDEIIDMKTSSKRLNTSYKNIELHVLRYEKDKNIDDWKHDIYNITYLGEYNQYIGIMKYFVHESAWSTNLINYHISEGDYVYFVIDGQKVDVKLGVVLTNIYQNVFSIDEKQMFIKKERGNLINNNLYIFFEDGYIYLDMNYVFPA